MSTRKTSDWFCFGVTRAKRFDWSISSRGREKNGALTTIFLIFAFPHWRYISSLKRICENVKKYMYLMRKMLDTTVDDPSHQPDQILILIDTCRVSPRLFRACFSCSQPCVVPLSLSLCKCSSQQLNKYLPTRTLNMFASRRANSAASVHEQRRICSDLHRTNICDQSCGIV